MIVPESSARAVSNTHKLLEREKHQRPQGFETLLLSMQTALSMRPSFRFLNS